MFDSLNSYNSYRLNSTTTPLTFVIPNDGNVIDYNGASVSITGKHITYYENYSGARTSAQTVQYGGSSSSNQQAPTTAAVQRPLPQISFATNPAPGFSVRPTSDTRKGTLTLKGENFSDLTAITIGGKKADFTVKDGKLEIKLPAGVTGFPEVVMTNGGGSITIASTVTATVPNGYIDNLALSYNSMTVMNVAAGVCADSTNAKLLTLAAFTKTLQSSGAWTAGSGNNGLDTGARASITWYHVFVIADSTGATVDVLFSLSATAPTMPSGYTLFRRVGSMQTNTSGHWRSWFQRGDTFLWDVPIDDISALNPGTSAVTRTLSTPTGVRTCALVSVGFDATATGDNPAAIYLSDLSQTDTAASVTVNTYVNYSATAHIANTLGRAEIWTNTSAQIRSRLQASATNTRLRIQTHGWIDLRGRDGL